MFKGLINYKDGKIPFVIEEFRLILFSEKELVREFCKEHNRKRNYLLTGECYSFGNQPSQITLLVEHSMAEICYIKCYIIDKPLIDRTIDTISFESNVLDSILRYKYHYIDFAREGVNLSSKEIEIYKIPFEACGKAYELKYHIGHNNSMGLLESFKMRGKVSIELKTSDIKECYRLTRLLERFSKFLTSISEVSFERIQLCEGNLPIAKFYCKSISDRKVIDHDLRFYDFQVERYSSKILNNLAIDLDSKIMKSIPLGHISDFDNMYTPKRFIDELTSFEYLFEKLESNKAKNRKYTLAKELKFMFDLFPEVLSGSNIDSYEVSKCIKELRTNIIHGYAYYYDFSDDTREDYYIVVLAKLIQKMSLKLIGFSDLEIKEIGKFLFAL